MYFQEAYFVYLSCTLEEAQGIAIYPALSGGAAGGAMPALCLLPLKKQGACTSSIVGANVLNLLTENRSGFYSYG
jgi:hypothetical protein